MEKTEVMEPLEEETEVLEPEIRETALDVNQIDSIVAVAESMDKFSKAMDTIIGHIMKRAYPGDFVVHAKQSDPEDKKKANIGSAAAERIAAFLCIQETNWKDHGKEWSEDHKHYTYSFSADFSFGKRTVHAIGRVGTRDKFFGFSHGQWKPLDEVQEDHIRTAAQRACRKEGVRALLGLRGIPLSKLKELGFDLSKVAYASYENKGTALSADEKKPAESGLIEREVMLKEIQYFEGTSQKGAKWFRADVWDTKGVKYGMFYDQKAPSERLMALVDAKEQGLPVKLSVRLREFKGNEQYEIVKVQGLEN